MTKASINKQLFQSLTHLKAPFFHFLEKSSYFWLLGLWATFPYTWFLTIRWNSLFKAQFASFPSFSMQGFPHIASLLGTFEGLN